ncbi:MAG TPA: histidine phosphatase family protein [Polyangiaceae bacterium]|nr:histidine phosphatase family protein [Polyangiaceae bacterium]
MPSRHVYLARHGETDWNLAGRWQGHTDVPLNKTGEEQARSMAHALQGIDLGAVVSSDLSRARHTARIVAQTLGVRVSYVDADLRERALGSFEGLTREECERLHPDEWRAWIEHRTPPKGGEAQDRLAARVIGAIIRAMRAARAADGAAFVVTHGGALRAALSVTLGLMPPPIKNGAIWRLELEEDAILAAEPLP